MRPYEGREEILGDPSTSLRMTMVGGGALSLAMTVFSLYTKSIPVGVAVTLEP